MRNLAYKFNVTYRIDPHQPGQAYGVAHTGDTYVVDGKVLFTRDARLPAPIFERRSVTDDLPVNGVYRAGSDHRKDGQAAGW